MLFFAAGLVLGIALGLLALWRANRISRRADAVRDGVVEGLEQSLRKAKADAENLGKMLDAEVETGTVNSGILAEVCDIAFDDDERAANYAYAGIRDRARELAADSKALVGLRQAMEATNNVMQHIALALGVKGVGNVDELLELVEAVTTGDRSFQAGVLAFTEAIENTCDEYGEDLEAAMGRMSELLNAVRRGDGQETWSKYACPSPPPDCRHCGYTMTDPPTDPCSAFSGSCQPEEGA